MVRCVLFSMSTAGTCCFIRIMHFKLPVVENDPSSVSRSSLSILMLKVTAKDCGSGWPEKHAGILPNPNRGTSRYSLTFHLLAHLSLAAGQFGSEDIGMQMSRRLHIRSLI